jgi:hypothetical protein
MKEAIKEHFRFWRVVYAIWSLDFLMVIILAMLIKFL